MSKPALEPILTIGPDEIPSAWRLASIPELVGDAGVFVDGDWVESKDQDPNGDVRLIQLADIGDGAYRNKSSRFLTSKKAVELRCNFLLQGDVLIARMPDPLGRACIFPGDAKRAVTVVDVAMVRSGNDEFNHRWLMYFTNSPVFRNAIDSLQSGTTRKRISRKNLGRLKLPVPPRDQQDSIVAEIEKQFSRLDEAVASLKRVKANLKRYKAAVLKAAVEGKLTEEWREQNPDVEPASKLLGRILAERRTKWEEIELAKMKTKGKEPKDDKWKEKYADLDTASIDLKSPVPETWCNVAIGQVFEVAVGATPSRREPMYWDGGIPWVSSGEVDFCKITRTRETISAEGLANSSTKMSPIGTVLLGMIGEGKTRGQAAILEIEACNNQNSAAIRVSETEVLPMYLYYFLVSQYEETRRRGSGGNQPALNKSRVQRIAFPLPPVSEQIEIVSKVERLLSMEDAVFNALIKNSRKTRSCRQAFLARAFAGDMLEARD